MTISFLSSEAHMLHIVASHVRTEHCSGVHREENIDNLLILEQTGGKNEQASVMLLSITGW